MNPLLEDQIRAAVRNNVTATRAVAEAASRRGCERYILRPMLPEWHPEPRGHTLSTEPLSTEALSTRAAQDRRNADA